MRLYFRAFGSTRLYNYNQPLTFSKLLFFVRTAEIGQGVAFDGRPELAAVQMRVYLRGGDAHVSKQFLERPYVNIPVLVHQCGGCMPQFMDGIPFRVETCGYYVLLDDLLDGFPADPPFAAAQEQSVLIPD